MKIALDLIKTFTKLPESLRATRDMFDDLGLEVKRLEATGPHGPVFTLELLANRGDHHSYLGVARELSGRTGAPVHEPAFTTLTVGPGAMSVRVESDLCLVYTLTVLEHASLAPTVSTWGVSPILEAAGLKSVNPAVDATNQANLEFGQPTHAFDADTLDGGIVVRTSRAGERAWLLFTTEPVELPEGTLVITDSSKILAIAGVIGCEESKTTVATKRIALESATFDPIAVRRASRALGMHTDSSARFERGGDPTLPLIGAGRVAHILGPLGWKVRSTTTFSHWVNPERYITLRTAKANAFLDVTLTAKDMGERLTRYGFGISLEGADPLSDVVRVGVPPHRLWDVETVADLYEELARSIGYNHTPTYLPPVEMGTLPSRAEIARLRVDDVLVGNGFYEVFTDGFHGRELRDRLDLTDHHPLFHHVETLNSLDRGYSFLKNSPFAQAVEAVAENLRLQRREVRAFEWTRIFLPDAQAENGLCRERKVLWFIAAGPARSPSWSEAPPAFSTHHARGIFQEIATAVNLPLEFLAMPDGHPLAALLHPHRRAVVRLQGEVVGAFGEVHPKLCANWKIKRERPVYAEINSDVFQHSPQKPTFVEASEVRPIERNLAFTLPPRVTGGEVAQYLLHSGPTELQRVDIIDRFDHTLEGHPVHTLTFALSFDASERSLSGDEVNRSCEALIAAVHQTFGHRGVRLRA